MKDKHIVMEIDLRVSPPRTIEDARIEAIGNGEPENWIEEWAPVYFDAYEDSPAKIEKDKEGAREYLRCVVEGDYGEFLPWASFVYREEGEVQGVVLMTFFRKQGLLADLFVARRRRSGGIGTALLNRALVAMARRKKFRVQLSVVASNPARRIYEKIGFYQKNEKEEG